MGFLENLNARLEEGIAKSEAKADEHRAKAEQIKNDYQVDKHQRHARAEADRLQREQQTAVKAEEHHARMERLTADADAAKQQMKKSPVPAPRPVQPEVATRPAQPPESADSSVAVSDQSVEEGGWRALGRKIGSFADLHAFDATVKVKAGSAQLSGGKVSASTGLLNSFKGIPADQVEVELIEVSDTSRVTATRVVAGTLLVPGVGTLVGALAKKKTGNSALVLVHGTTTIELPLAANDLVAARGFVRNLARATGNTPS